MARTKTNGTKDSSANLGFGWFRKDDDVRWQFGVPPKGNANFVWVQHFIHHLALEGNINGRQTLN